MKKLSCLLLIAVVVLAIAECSNRNFLGLPVFHPTRRGDTTTSTTGAPATRRGSLLNILKPVNQVVGAVTDTVSSVAHLLLKPFQDFTKKYNKQYSSPEEEKKRLEIFAQNKKKVDELEKRPSSFLYRINELSDFLITEILKFFGGLRYRPYKRISTTSTSTTTSTTTTTTTTQKPTTPEISIRLPEIDSTTAETPITSSTTTTTTTTEAPISTTDTTTITTPCTSTPTPTSTSTAPSTTITTRCTSTPTPTSTSTTPIPTTTTQASITEEGQPGNVDWRRVNCMSEVRYQGKCAASFAFATTAAIEAHLCYKTGKRYTLSPQNLIDCTIASPYENSGCEGGALEPTYDYIVNVGINSENDYPYEGSVGRCRFKSDKSLGKIKDYMSVDEGDEETLEHVLTNFGPISIGIDATHESFRFYGGGIYYEPMCKSNIESLNHAVLLVGFGEEADGQKYWLIRNSYGTSWGDNGYGKIARNVSNHCGVSTYAVYPIVT